MQNLIRNTEVNNQPRHVHQCRHERGRGCGRIKSEAPHRNGSMEPARLPKSTTPIRLHATVAATSR